MRNFCLAVTLVSLVFAPAIAAAASPSWQPATATVVSAGVKKSTFIIQAYVTLPQSCDTARIRTLSINSQLHRSFIVEQMAPSSPCSGKTAYKCTVVSPEFQLPIQHPFEVESKGKAWEVAPAMEPPTPVEPMCRKA